MTSLDFNFAEPIASYNNTADDNMDSSPKDIGAIRKSDFIVLNGRPLKVVEVTHAKPGKHGHAKVPIAVLSLLCHLSHPFVSRFIRSVSTYSQVVGTKMFVRLDT